MITDSEILTVRISPFNVYIATFHARKFLDAKFGTMFSDDARTSVQAGGWDNLLTGQFGEISWPILVHGEKAGVKLYNWRRIQRNRTPTEGEGTEPDYDGAELKARRRRPIHRWGLTDYDLIIRARQRHSNMTFVMPIVEYPDLLLELEHMPIKEYQFYPKWPEVVVSFIGWATAAEMGDKITGGFYGGSYYKRLGRDLNPMREHPVIKELSKSA